MVALMNKVTLPVSATVMTNESSQEEIIKSPEVIKTEDPVKGLSQKIELLEQQLKLQERHIAELEESLVENRSLDELSNLLGELSNTVTIELEQFSENASQVVMSALIKILGDAMVRPEVSLAAVKQVLKIGNSDDVQQVLVSAQDFALIQKYKNQLGLDKQFTFKVDEKVQTGGCILNMDSGVVDGRLDVQLKTLYETLKGVKF